MRARAFCTQRAVALDLLVGETEVAEAIFLLAVLAQLAEEAGGAALSGGGGIVELVAEVGGELAERVEFFRLLLDAGDLADAVKQNRDTALGHRRDGSEHLGKEGIGDVERPDGPDREAFAAVVLHAREGKLAGHGAGAPDEERDVACMTAAHLHLAAEDEVHIVGRVVVAEENGAVGADALGAVRREPQVLFLSEAVELGDGAERSDNFWDGCRLGWRAGKDRLICRDNLLLREQTLVAVQGGHLGGAPLGAWSWLGLVDLRLHCYRSSVRIVKSRVTQNRCFIDAFRTIPDRT